MMRAPLPSACTSAMWIRSQLKERTHNHNIDLLRSTLEVLAVKSRACSGMDQDGSVINFKLIELFAATIKPDYSQ